MKRNLFYVVMLMVLAVSCKDNLTEPFLADTTEAVSKFYFTATIDNGPQNKTTDDNGLQTRSTVEYGNTNYASGEKSLWLAGDEIAILFYMPETTTLIASTVFKTTNGGSSAQIAHVGGIMPTLNQNYDIKAVYPASTLGGGHLYYSSSYKDAFGNPYFNIGDATSADNISEYDLMYAESNNVYVSEEGVDLSFTHKLSMLRFSILNSTTQNVYVDEIRIHSSKYKNTFYEMGRVNTSTNFDIIKASPSYEIVASVERATGPEPWPGKILADIGITDFYLMLLENDVVDATDNFGITVMYRRGGISNPINVQMFNIPRAGYGFLQSSFEGSKRYLFKLNLPQFANTTAVTYNDIEYYRNATTGEVWATQIPEAVGKENITISETGTTFPWNVTRIFNPESNGNTVVEKIFLPPSILCVSSNVFEDYTALREIHMYSPEPPRMGSDLFAGCLSGIVIHIPNDATIIAAYNDAIQNKKMGWSGYSNTPGFLTAGGQTTLVGAFGIGAGNTVIINANLTALDGGSITSGGEYIGW